MSEVQTKSKLAVRTVLQKVFIDYKPVKVDTLERLTWNELSVWPIIVCQCQSQNPFAAVYVKPNELIYFTETDKTQWLSRTIFNCQDFTELKPFPGLSKDRKLNGKSSSFTDFPEQWKHRQQLNDACKKVIFSIQTAVMWLVTGLHQIWIFNTVHGRWLINENIHLSRDTPDSQRVELPPD